jgi:hypothetical protein
VRLGVKSRYGRKIEVELPVDVSVWLSPSRCRWDHLPEAPFSIVRREFGPDDHAMFFGWEQDIPTIVEAVTSFSRRHLPRPNQWAFMTDASLQIVLGWRHYGTSLEWDGCEYMFQVLEASDFTNPVDVALWESLAREDATSHTPLEANHGRTRPATNPAP